MISILKKSCNIFRKRIPDCYGDEFKRLLSFLEESQWWEKDLLSEYQNRTLNRLVHHCFKYVPYYRKRKDIYRYKEGKEYYKSDLSNFPFLTKDMIQKNCEELIASDFPHKSLEYHTTGGTSGTPLGIWMNNATHIKRLAFDWRYYHWGNYNFNDKCVILRGIRVPHFDKGNRTFFDSYNNHLILSSFDLSEKVLENHIEEMNRFKPRVVRGYPSVLTIISQFAENNNIELNNDNYLETIFTSSETLTGYQRKYIERIFKTRVLDLYGNTEQTARLGECGNGYHQFSEYGIIEFDDIPGTDKKEIIATGFTNLVMPLLRYRTGDIAVVSRKKCKCGRGLPIVKTLEGRVQDLAISKNGTPISLTSFFFAIHIPEMNCIKKIQFIQENPGVLIVNAVKGEKYTDKVFESLLSKLNSNLSIKFDLIPNIVEEIPVTISGKHRLFIQKMNLRKT